MFCHYSEFRINPIYCRFYPFHSLPVLQATLISPYSLIPYKKPSFSLYFILSFDIPHLCLHIHSQEMNYRPHHSFSYFTPDAIPVSNLNDDQSLYLSLAKPRHNTDLISTSNILAQTKDYKRISLCEGRKIGFPCKKWRHCSYCSYIQSQTLISRILPDNLKYASDFYFTTISHLSNKQHSLDSKSIHKFFSMYSKKICSRVPSYLCFKEISVSCFYPETLINPHLHIIHYGPLPSGIKFSKSLSVDSRPVNSLPHLVSYLCKPLNFEDSYSLDIGHSLYKTNLHVDKFLHFFEKLFEGKRQFSHCNFFE